MTIDLVLDVQYATEEDELPSEEMLALWIKKALPRTFDSIELTVRLVDIEESSQLNKVHRGKNKPTNILSFPFSLPKGIQLPVPLLGDLVFCVPIVLQEAKQQSKELFAHWAHLTIHGTLHLLGYDHENDQDAEKMENLEIKLMSELGYPNPYISTSPG